MKMGHWMRRLISRTIIAAIGITAGMLIVTDNALHVQPRMMPASNGAAEAIARNTSSIWEAVQVSARDSIVLDGWVFTPRDPNGLGVIALHGISDTRLGMLAHAAFLLREGFTVVVPDSRGHGRSGGHVITYGINEATDVHTWADWLVQNRHVEQLFGIGQSMGAAILIQSITVERRFCAIVADSPFANFEEIAYDRLQQISRMPKLVFWPVVHLGFDYARLRYGADLWRASPINAVRNATTPILLIHGTNDSNIPIRHSEELHAANMSMTTLWAVQGAEHVASFSTNPERYTKMVTGWFRSHPCGRAAAGAPFGLQLQHW
jgi:dipeptidyl aminopeptidase/acylaminoacyl peptidase